MGKDLSLYAELVNEHNDAKFLCMGCNGVARTNSLKTAKTNSWKEKLDAREKMKTTVLKRTKMRLTEWRTVLTYTNSECKTSRMKRYP